MESHPETKIQNLLQYWAKLMMISVLVISLVVFIGWSYNIDFLKRPFPNWIPMNPLSALSFILSVGSFFFLLSIKKTKQKIISGKILALIVFLIGSIKLIGIFTAFDLHIDQLLFPNEIKNGSAYANYNLMAPNTSGT